MPLQLGEIPEKSRPDQILYGSYPELVTRKYENTDEWHASYINNYIERDVRSLYNIGNLRDFQRLVMLIAARAAQELNMSELANEIGVNVKTIQSWLSVLEAGYLIFFLQSYHRNLGKRIVKRPKIYFYDTGLICYLTGISNIDILNKGPLAGPIFENYVISEIKKSILHNDKKIGLYYFRGSQGLEVDLILDDKKGGIIQFIEIKNSYTAKPGMIESLAKLMEIEKNSPHAAPVNIKGSLVFRGKDDVKFLDNISCVNYLNFINNVNTMHMNQ